MLTKTRKHKINSRKKKIKTILGVFLFLAILSLGILIYINFTKKSLFISPLPVNYQLSSEADSDQQLLLLKKLLKENNIEYSDITISGKYLVVNMKDKSKIIFSTDKDLSIQIASLQFILTRLTMESRRFSELDLRFDKPVIRR